MDDLLKAPSPVTVINHKHMMRYNGRMDFDKKTNLMHFKCDFPHCGREMLVSQDVMGYPRETVKKKDWLDEMVEQLLTPSVPPSAEDISHGFLGGIGNG